MERGRAGENRGGRNLAAIQRTPVSTLVLLGATPLALLIASGCYTDKINKAPVAKITVEGGTQQLLIIGPKPTLSGRLSSDPDHEEPRYLWTFRCADASVACVFDDPVQSTRDITLELAHDPFAHEAVVATLRVTDPRGASSEASQTFTPINQPPKIEIGESATNLKNRNGKYTVGRELTLEVKITSDPDLDPILLPTWSIRKKPNGAAPQLGATQGDTFAFRPDKASEDEWTVRATLEDGFGGSSYAEVDLKVQDDLPPCLEGLDPALPDGFAVVVHRAGGPRSFTVGTVEDDLDGFPPATTGDDKSGAATFRWSLVLPGPTPTPPSPPVPQVVGGQVSNVFSFDPATYAPGDHVAVRVDVLDSVERSCPVEQATCTAEAECLSRYTWNVEVR
jgi:hypothetical protein